MEAAAYLAAGVAIRTAIESAKYGWTRLSAIARVWQPSRLKGVVVSAKFGTPFLAATQVFDLRPTSRKWLSLEQTDSAQDRFVKVGTILVTCSGNVGKTTIAHSPLKGVLVSHDLMRIEVIDETLWGWIYALLRARQSLEMMGAAQYGHVIKHLEVSHLNALPIPILKRELREHFNGLVRGIFERRDRAHALIAEAEKLYESALGSLEIPADPEAGFVVPAKSLFEGRRRFEGSFHNPLVAAILKRCDHAGRKVETLADVTERVWWITRFKRVFGAAGAPYLSAEELFSLNQPPTKRVLMEQAENADRFFVKSGWLVMACSGQVYGMNGNVAMMTKRHERAFLSHDLVRIIPDETKIRGGYLLIALSHPSHGRPLVIRQAYGTSIPHLEPADVASVPVVRLASATEKAIADRAEEAVRLRSEADDMEDAIAAEAAAVIDRVATGDLSDLESLIGRESTRHSPT
jgi:type I restriction enzyme, S subunit